MNAEEMKQAAVKAATENGGKLRSLPNGRWQGAGPGLQFDSASIRSWIKEGVFTVTQMSEPLKNEKGEILHRMKGSPTEVTLA